MSSLSDNRDAPLSPRPGEAPGAVPPLALVTGGGGFLGRHIVAKLLAGGWRVRVFGRRPYPDLAARGVECAQGDIANFVAVRAACRGVDTVFHTAALAAMSGARHRFVGVNATGTVTALAAAEAAGVFRFIHTSTPSVVFGTRGIAGGDESLPYPRRHLSHYAATKAMAERAVLAADGAASGLRTVALRPHLVWGPGDTNLLPSLLARAEAGQLRRVGGGRNLVSVSYVENVADAHLAACEKLGSDPDLVGGRVYFVNDDEPVNCWDFIGEFISRSQLPPLRRGVPAAVAYAAGALAELRAWAGAHRREPPMTRFLARQLSANHWFRNDAAKRDLDWRPAIDREEAWKRTLADVKAMRRRLVRQHLGEEVDTR